MTSQPDHPDGCPPPASDAGTLSPAAPAPAAPSETVTLRPVSADAPPVETVIPVQVPGYEILGELGRGGMGVVYKARQIKLDRVVALKMILAGGHAGEAELARFRAEAEAVARLQHPNIVQIFEVGEHGGLPFFSLEFCGGGSLDKKLAGTPLPPKEAAALVATLARAVQTAHEKGVIHRDLKPANILLTEDGTPKITDFGLAKRLDADAGQTRTGSVMGTPSYMAPEQAGGKTAEMGPLCDVYALGAILYELLTGRPPFRAATPLDTMMQVVSDDPVPPRHLQPRTPHDLETICLKCLRKERGKRYASAAALAEDLRRFLAGEPVKARPMGLMGRTAKWVRRRPAVAALLAAVAAVAAAGFAGISWQYGEAARERDNARAEAGNAHRPEDRGGGKGEGSGRQDGRAPAGRRIDAPARPAALRTRRNPSGPAVDGAGWRLPTRRAPTTWRMRPAGTSAPGRGNCTPSPSCCRTPERPCPGSPTAPTGSSWRLAARTGWSDCGTRIWASPSASRAMPNRR